VTTRRFMFAQPLSFAGSGFVAQPGRGWATVRASARLDGLQIRQEIVAVSQHVPLAIDKTHSVRRCVGPSVEVDEQVREVKPVPGFGRWPVVYDVAVCAVYGNPTAGDQKALEIDVWRLEFVVNYGRHRAGMPPPRACRCATLLSSFALCFVHALPPDQCTLFHAFLLSDWSKMMPRMLACTLRCPQGVCSSANTHIDTDTSCNFTASMRCRNAAIICFLPHFTALTRREHLYPNSTTSRAQIMSSARIDRDEVMEGSVVRSWCP